jgi:hypothetical protein
MLFVEKNYVLRFVKVSLMIGDPDRLPGQIFPSYLPLSVAWFEGVPQTIRALLAAVASWGMYHLGVHVTFVGKDLSLIVRYPYAGQGLVPNTWPDFWRIWRLTSVVFTRQRVKV